MVTLQQASMDGLSDPIELDSMYVRRNGLIPDWQKLITVYCIHINFLGHDSCKSAHTFMKMNMSIPSLPKTGVW